MKGTLQNYSTTIMFQDMGHNPSRLKQCCSLQNFFIPWYNQKHP